MPIPSLVYLDRYRNEGTRTYSNHAAYTEAGEAYRPDAPHAGFELPLFEVPRDRMLVHTVNPPPALSSAFLATDRVPFCIHPQVLEQRPEDLYVRRTLELSRGRSHVAVLPSSSTRTLYATDAEHPHAIKVHFPFKISRYSRKMRHEVVEQALNVSRELEAQIDHLDDRFAFLREVIGVSHPNMDPDSTRGEHWGYLVRDMTPFPGVKAERRLIPGFALYGRDYFEPDRTLLLYELIGQGDPVAYVLDNIMLPIVRHWVQCFRQFGYLLEPHGQNVVLELGPDHSVARIVHRDLSVAIDMRWRRDMRLSDRGLNGYNRTEHNAFHSISYDRFMGGHFFERLVSACQQRYPKLSSEDFRLPCRMEFARLLPEYSAYFPKTVWYFDEKRDQFDKPLFQDTGIAPTWRP